MTEQRIIVADVLDGLRSLPDASVQCCVTSPPYWGLRDYGVDGQIGLEKTPAEYNAKMVEVFREVWRVLRDDGTCWVNIGDSYTSGGRATFGTLSDDSKQATHANIKSTPRAQQPPGMKPKDLVGIPWMLAFALRDDGWYLRQDVIWHKPAPMPESVRDRCTKSHEYIFLLTKRGRYYYDAEAVKEASVDPEGSAKRYAAPFFIGDKHESGGYSPIGATHTAGMKQFNGTRNLRSVWTMASQGFAEAHFATFPVELPERCIRAGTSLKGCCPTCGAPWRRVVTTERVPTRPGTNSKVHGVTSVHAESHYHDHKGVICGNRDPQRHNSVSATVGWHPTCDHGGEPVPCTVLDPFCGAATTLLAAQRLGRRGIGIELNPEYAAMGKRRLEGEAPLLARVATEDCGF